MNHVVHVVHRLASEVDPELFDPWFWVGIVLILVVVFGLVIEHHSRWSRLF